MKENLFISSYEIADILNTTAEMVRYHIKVMKNQGRLNAKVLLRLEQGKFWNIWVIKSASVMSEANGFYREVASIYKVIYAYGKRRTKVDTNDLKPYLAVAMNQSDAHYKALANFMFREIIEDAHAKYNISDEDVSKSCK